MAQKLNRIFTSTHVQWLLFGLKHTLDCLGSRFYVNEAGVLVSMDTSVARQYINLVQPLPGWLSFFPLLWRRQRKAKKPPPFK